MADQQNPHIGYQDAIDLLNRQCRARPIVPFLGAGISVASGFPTISAIVEYLSKVDFAIQNEVYSHRYPDIQIYKKEVAREYREHPSRFLRDFGWPRLGQLEADLWEWLDREFNSTLPIESDPSIKHAAGKAAVVSEGVDNVPIGFGRKQLLVRDLQLLIEQEQYRQRQIASRNLPHSSKPELLDLLSRDICPSSHLLQVVSQVSHGEITKFKITPVIAEENPQVITLDLRDHLRAIAQWGLRKDLRLRETGTSNAAMLEWLQWKKWYASGRDAPDTQPELLYGDWESLLDHLCEGDFDLVDSLFTSFEEGRSPTTAHRFLTFLRSSVDLPLILSTNFDSLLERTFRDGGVVPKVFDVHRDADLPDADLVRRGFSLLKLHGSSYGLRLGERLRSPFERDAQADVLRYLPENALVVVLGFSGSERRIMQLLQTIATSSVITDPCRILWLKGPGTISVPLQQLLHECRQSVQIAEINDAGAFLQDWYFAYSQGYQSSPVSYSALGGRPIRSNNDEIVDSVEFHRPELRCEFRKPVQLFVRDSSGEKNQEVSSCATLAAGEFIAHLGHRYHPIWIDLESHHTVSGVVTELFDHFRTFDPDAPRVAIVDSAEGDVSDDILQKAVDRIGEMLERGRYVIVFDAIEAFGRTQMMHHGIPTYELLKKVDEERHDTLVEEFRTRVNALQKFLEKLLFMDTGSTSSGNAATPDALLPDSAIRYFLDSYIILAADKEQPRQAGKESGNFLTVNTMKRIREFLTLRPSWPNHVHRTLVKAEPAPHALADAWDVKAAIPTVEVLEKRAVSILLLKKVPSRNPWLFLEDATESAALVAVLSVFRRPLSIPVMRSLTERWLLPKKHHVSASIHTPESAEPVQVAHDYVDHVLRALQKGRHLVIHQGGRIRLERSIHEQFYGALTSELHVGSVILEWEERYASDASRRAYVIVQGALAASLHFAAARTMYVDVFLLTRDVQAFYEYLYHRVAVLRILMVMSAMLRLPLPKALGTGPATIYDEVSKVLTRIYTQYRASQDGSKIAEDQGVLHWFLHTVGLTDVVDPDDEQITRFDLHCYLQRLRLHALQTLSLAIGRSERLLRYNASPDTLIGWARQFNQREQSDISGKVFETAHNAMPKRFGDESNVDAALKDLMLPQEALNAMLTTIESFNRIAAESYFAKMDFLSVLETELRRENSEIQASAIAKFSERAQALRKMVENILIDMSSRVSGIDTCDPLEKDVQRWLFPTRALSHLGWHDLVIVACDWAGTVLKAVSASKDSEKRARARRILRDFTELEVKARLGKECPPWHGLDGLWSFEGSEKLNKIEYLAVRYETLLRETSRDSLEDARHRSSAYVLRARVLYLQGRFQTAHRYLDLAACGSSGVNGEQAVGHAAIHLARAELLVYSSHLHLMRYDEMVRSGIDLTISEQNSYVALCSPEDEVEEIAKEANKIRRAESEVQRAAFLLDHAQHQTIWSLRMHIGIAQVTFARLLLDLEKIVRSNTAIEGNVFARLSGELEQSVLNGMRHLRSALDLLPFINESWNDICGSVTEHCPSVKDERKICALWMHLYVVSRFYWGVLQIWHAGAKKYETEHDRRAITVDEVITQVSGKPGRGEITWQMWCKSLRFNSFAEIKLRTWIGLAIEHYRQATDESPVIYSSAPLRLAILGICNMISSNNNLNAMWDRRRGFDSNGPVQKDQ